MDDRQESIILAVILTAGLLFALMTFLPQPSAGARNSDLLAMQPKFPVAASDVAYFGNTTGYLAVPDRPGTYPGVVMMHEWWGLNDNIRQMARALASQGYVVLAVDLYDGKVATTPQEAGALASSVNQSRALANMQAAVSYLRGTAKATKVASLGWCFGGGESLRLMVSGTKLDASVIYYGAPLITNETQLSAIKWPVQGVFGSEDQVIPLSSVYVFNSTLSALNVTHEVYVYRGVGHAFANPTGMTYAPNETKDSWNKTITFLDRNLKG